MGTVVEIKKFDSSIAENGCGDCQFNRQGTCSILRSFAEGGCDLFVERSDAAPIKRIEIRNGLKIGITHDPGDLRYSKSMMAGYGHVRGTYGQGEDGKAVDVYLGADLNSPKIYKVRQIDPATGEIDEHKYFVGFNSTKKVKDTFCYHAGSDRFGGVEPASDAELSAYRQDAIRRDGCGCSSVEELLESGVVEISAGLGYALQKADPDFLGEIAREVLEQKFPEPIAEILSAVKTETGVRGVFATLDQKYNFASKGWRIMGWKKRTCDPILSPNRVTAWISSPQELDGAADPSLFIKPEDIQILPIEIALNKDSVREDAKKIGRATWVHRSATEDLSDEQRSHLSKAREIAGTKARGANLYKFNGDKVSFLFYPNFESETNPALFKSVVVDVNSGSISEREASKQNPPILHRKETFVSKSDPNYEKYRQQTLSQEQKGYLKNTSKIGTKKGFEEAKLDESATEIANATDRPGGVFGGEPVVYRQAKKLASKSDKILDFGAGKEAVYTQKLRDLGYTVTAYDFGDNVGEIHDRNALLKKYDVVLASNVLNVQSTEESLNKTLSQIKNSTSGFAIVNYPDSPRKLGLSTEDFKQRLNKYFDAESIGSNVWKITPKGDRSDSIYSFQDMVSKENPTPKRKRENKGFG